MTTRGSHDARQLTSTAAPDGTLVRLDGVTKTYEPSSRLLGFFVRSPIREPVHALRGVDLELRTGQIKAIVGPNGAGKTTLFRILVGLTTPSSGRATVLGFDADRQAEDVRRHVGFMPSDDRSLFLRLTCAENLRFHGRIHGLTGRRLDRAIRDALDRVELGNRHDSAVFSLSAGMRARLQLARATLHMPALLLLDEPTSTIDPVASHRLLGLLVDIVEEHRMAALISSHRLEEIEALSGDVLLLDRGTVRFDGDLDQLHRLDRPKVQLVFASAFAAERALPRIRAAALVVEHLDALVECVPHDGVAVGELLAGLGDSLSGLLRCRELRLPLRDLLAQMYTDPAPSAVVP